MLFLPPGAATPVRLHGAYINLEEIESILSHITSQPCPEELFLPETFPYEIPEEFDNLPRLLGRATVQINTSKGDMTAIIDGYC